MFEEENEFALRLFKEMEVVVPVFVLTNEEFRKLERDVTSAAYYSLKNHEVVIHYGTAARLGEEKALCMNGNIDRNAKLGILLLAIHEASHVTDEYIQEKRTKAEYSIPKNSMEYLRAEIFVLARGKQLIARLSDELIGEMDYLNRKLRKSDLYNIFEKWSASNIPYVKGWEEINEEFHNQGDNLTRSN